jgi:hypothetical protein
MITRIDFVGGLVMGPSSRMFQTYTPKDWPGWTPTKGDEVITFRGPGGKSIEVPRSMCIVHDDPSADAAKEPVPPRLQQAATKAKSVAKDIAKDLAKKAEDLL